MRRTTSPKAAWALVGLLAAGAAPAAPPAEQLTAERFDELRKLIKPAADEDKWDQVPWLISLWEARREAAARGKPILLWEMDGHPLGCT
jgi:hypothetical protein